MDNELRTHLYRFLGQALAYPTPGFAGRLRDRLGETRLEMWGEGDLALGPLLKEARSLETMPLDQLQGEYTGLFINNHPQLPCPPYESAYREGRLLGNATAAVTGLYQQWGVEIHDEMADHVVAELEFMAFLAGLPQEAEVLAAQQGFLHDHLLAWLPRFAADVQQHTRLSFYRALAHLLAAFLDRETRTLEISEG